ncbi:hypothetical protein CPB84DRAFT_1858081 [Gymnopilus junonius]|uniref:Uncharacterized protein n=1 Tax=Gymnopilus junonius TaxID=109634 RepID=A0A9P5TEY6_GYMJU|nr:hypothetical protein CPB84DRAFT_1858081 [Gymnopilus junonius]
MQDEVEQALAHIGYCTINGFHVRVPYLLQDLCNIFSTDPAHGPENNMVLGAINSESNAREDQELLDSTNKYCYWWLEKYADTPMLPQVTRQHTFNHFYEFYNNLMFGSETGDSTYRDNYLHYLELDANIPAYELLEAVHSKHGIPFQDTKCLPEEYRGCIPRHDAHDGILKAIARNARNYVQWDGEMKPRPKHCIYNIRYVHPDQVNSGTPPPDLGSEDSGSGPTLVPDDFHPGSSNESSGSDQSARSLFEDKDMEDEEDSDGEEYGDDNSDQDDNEDINELAVV